MQSTHGKMSFRKKLRRAFTITELVIVIAVIAILAAVLIPTFSNVIENSKRSHDEQYVKEMNISLNAYAIQNGAPEDYEELMLALAGDGYCDASNPFLLATSLKQDNAYLIWYPRSNQIILVNLDDGNYSLTYSSELPGGNGVMLHDALDNSSTLGYALCNTGTAGHAYIAQLYYDYYVESGGDLSQFTANFGAQYTSSAINNNVSNGAWASSIIAALQNQALSYSYSSTIAEEITSQATGVGASISLTVPDVTASSGTDEYETQVAAREQSIRSSLATLVTLSNDTETAEDLEGDHIVFGTKGQTLDVTVDMGEVTMSAINPVHRDTVAANNNNLPGSYSVDFNGLTLDNYTIKDAFVANGASYQPASDNDYTGGAYNYAYGLFGTIYATSGEVVIENLNFTNVNLDLDGATNDALGNNVAIITDSAGIVCGTALGNVTFRNINIDGGTAADNTKGRIEGYDAIGSIVGRCYAEPGITTDTSASMVTINNCHVRDLIVSGVRKVGGFTGIWGTDCFLTVTDSSLTNVDVVGERAIEGDDDGDRKSTIAGLFVAHTNDYGNYATYHNQATGTNRIGSSFSNVTATNCRVINRYQSLSNAQQYVYFTGGLSVDMTGSGWDTNGSTGNPIYSSIEGGNVVHTISEQADNALILFGDMSTHCFSMNNVVIQVANSSDDVTWAYRYSCSINETAANGSDSPAQASHSRATFSYIGGVRGDYGAETIFSAKWDSNPTATAVN